MHRPESKSTPGTAAFTTPSGVTIVHRPDFTGVAQFPVKLPDGRTAWEEIPVADLMAFAMQAMRHDLLSAVAQLPDAGVIQTLAFINAQR